jgi:hypothetical protein
LTGAFGDEANIVHVGFTRAIRELHLPCDYKTIPTPEWQETIERYEPVQVFRRSKSSPTPRKKAIEHAFQGTRSGEFTIKVTINKALSESEPKPETLSKEEADEPTPEIRVLHQRWRV